MTHDNEELHSWRVSASAPVLKDRWIDLRADTCVTAAGATITPYYVLQPPEWVHVLAIDDADQAVLVRLYRHGMNGLSLELPGGAQDADDGSPEAGARRELLEETGYVCGPMRHIASLSPNPANHTNHVHVFLARGARYAQAPMREAGETMRTELVPVETLKQLALSGGILSAIHVAAILMALETM